MRMQILLPLQSKQYSHHMDEDKFLFFFAENNIFIMDNHRLSFWCFLNGSKNTKECSYIHIDDHFDCGDIEANKIIKRVKEKGINYYKNLNNFRKDEITVIDRDTNKYRKTFNYGNYLIPALFYNLFNNSKLYFFVKQDFGCFLNSGINDKNVFNGQPPKINHFQDKKIDDFKNVINKENNIILNIDFDYFFEFIDDNKERIIKDYFNIINDNKSKIKILILALTPQHSWSNSEKILKIASEIFDLDISISLAPDKK